MFRRIVLIAALVLAAGAGAVTAPAGAQQYGGCNASVSDSTPAAGQTITVSGTGADASSTVKASLKGTQVGSGTSDAEGAFSFSATVPASASGTQTLKVNCGEGSGVVSLTLTVAGGSSGLPRTGASDTANLTAAALLALTLGGVALAAARIRRGKVSSL